MLFWRDMLASAQHFQVLVRPYSPSSEPEGTCGGEAPSNIPRDIIKAYKAQEATQFSWEDQ